MNGGGKITRRMLLGQLATMAPLAGVALAQYDDDPLRTLRVAHPRLILLDSELERLRTLTRENALAHRIYSDLERECERLLTVTPIEYRAAAPRNLQQANHILDRVMTLALMYRLTGRDLYLRRAAAELRAAANFRDWNPARFTETAVMTHAVALGYDWLYNALNADDRALLRSAIATKGLDPALPLYPREGAWPHDHYNANVICNAAMGLGALAIAGDPASEAEKPFNDRSAAMLKLVLESIPRGLANYGVEGSWPEGPEYWNSVTKYACALFNGMQTALGNDYGLSSFHGVDRAGRFRIYTTGPGGRVFNFADSVEEAAVAPEMYWLAKRFGNPVYAWSEQKALERSTHPDAYDLVWLQHDGKSPQQPPAWVAWSLFRGVDVASVRSAWDDPNATYLAVKGGDNKDAHAHLDLGSFVLDAGGVRWAADLGPDDYDLPGYIAGRQRWTYYRTRTEAHNTLLVDGENQDTRAEARITRQEFAPDFSWVQIDLSRANGGRIRQWTRRIGLAQREAVLVEDSVHCEQPVEIIWGMMTDADVTVSGQTAALKKNGWTLAAEIRTPRHAVFDVAPVHAPAPQAQNTGFRKLIVRLGDKVTDLDLNIVLTPWKDGTPKPKVTVQFPA